MMVTGSHIPFSRNGYKTNSAIGELLKADEGPITRHVEQWRSRLYTENAADSAFDDRGNFKYGSRPCCAIDDAGSREYIERYSRFFGATALAGIRVLVYQHSAVGRDLLLETLQTLGAEVQPIGRSETFVPIDTEAIDDATLEQIRALAQQASSEENRFDAVVSTDGDSDRPLLLGLSYDANARCEAKFFGGDLVGMLVAAQLRPDAVVVPVSCNDAIDRSTLAPVLRPKTRIGSPYVIAGMNAAREAGARGICGWEANGGFLTGSSFSLNHGPLPALPTRDAFLPVLMVLSQMASTGRRMEDLFNSLPRRFSRAGLLRDCPRTASQRIVASFESTDQGGISAELTEHVARYFGPDLGFDGLNRIDYTDGVRMYFNNGDVAHIRPSGNADELRIYAVADTQERADEIVRATAVEPNGVLQRLRDEA
jgi:phosphomannomutase